MNFFSRKSYKGPPPEWSKRELTYWDSCLFARNDSPTIGWVIEGTDVDTHLVASSLERAIRIRAPWLRGRFAKTESGCPPFEIHVPPENDSTVAFNITTSHIQDPLASVISYTPTGHLRGEISTTPTFDPNILSPRTTITGVEEYISKSLPILHLHFILAPDATFISLSWSHAIMDALACGEIVKAWELAFSHCYTTSPYPDINPSTFFSFTDPVILEEGWQQPGWITFTPLQLIRLLIPYLYETYTHPLVHGTMFFPSRMITKWMETAKAEFSDGDYVSRNDLVTSWIFKHAFGGTYFKDAEWATLFTAICFRGRHPMLSKEAITNTAKSHSVPPFTTLELRTMTLAQIALRLRKSMEVFEDEGFVEKAVAHEVRMMRKGNGKTSEIPVGRLDARACGTTSWAKMGLGSPRFGRVDESGSGSGMKVLATVTWNTGRGCATVIDCEEGDWRVDYKMSARQWGALREQMEKENEGLMG